MHNDAQSPDPIAPTRPSATGCGARFELALVAAFKGGAIPLAPHPPLPRG
ncbi:hypothetical protein [Sphingomonas sp. Leaf23]|nr:hypothetical protein [Sphingomonas sp. Leaf23]